MYNKKIFNFLKYTCVGTLILLFSVVIIQGIPLYELLADSKGIKEGDTREEVFKLIGEPDIEWAKSTSLDFWKKDFLLGGLSISILYTGGYCSIGYPGNVNTKCKVSDIRKIYYTLWGNRWFLSFQPT